MPSATLFNNGMPLSISSSSPGKYSRKAPTAAINAAIPAITADIEPRPINAAGPVCPTALSIKVDADNESKRIDNEAATPRTSFTGNPANTYKMPANMATAAVITISVPFAVPINFVETASNENIPINIEMAAVAPAKRDGSIIDKVPTAMAITAIAAVNTIIVDFTLSAFPANLDITTNAAKHASILTIAPTA